MKDLIIRQITTDSPEYETLLDLRDLILRKPLGLRLRDEDLSDDAKDIILAAFDKEEMTGCVMMHPLDGRRIKLRQMAVLEAWQGKGVGSLLVEAGEKASGEGGYEEIVLHARITAKAFYEKMGYRQKGDVFTEVNIPHVVMEKQVK